MPVHGKFSWELTGFDKEKQKIPFFLEQFLWLRDGIEKEIDK